jgi:hypothetical protein
MTPLDIAVVMPATVTAMISPPEAGTPMHRGYNAKNNLIDFLETDTIRTFGVSQFCPDLVNPRSKQQPYLILYKLHGITVQ